MDPSDDEWLANAAEALDSGAVEARDEEVQKDLAGELLDESCQKIIADARKCKMPSQPLKKRWNELLDAVESASAETSIKITPAKRPNRLSLSKAPKKPKLSRQESQVARVADKRHTFDVEAAPKRIEFISEDEGDDEHLTSNPDKKA